MTTPTNSPSPQGTRTRSPVFRFVFVAMSTSPGRLSAEQPAEVRCDLGVQGTCKSVQRPAPTPEGRKGERGVFAPERRQLRLVGVGDRVPGLVEPVEVHLTTCRRNVASG